MAILRIRDENGNVQEIVALRGPKGERGIDAYAKAKEYGYGGTEEQFYLAMGQNGSISSSDYIAPITTSWQENEGEFYQDVSVPGILETDEPFPDIVPGASRSETKEYRKAFEAVTDIETHADYARVWAERAIEIPFSIRLKVVR